MLHPQARALLALIESLGVPPMHTLSVDDARALYRDRRGVTQPPPQDVAAVEALAVPAPHGEIALRLYRPVAPSGPPLPVLLWLHGGGWTIGDLDTHDTLCRALALQAGCAVVSVDYRLAPEHRFPAAVDDAVAATRWLHAHAAALGLDAGRLVAGGDSAGGNLAAVVALATRDEGGPPLAGQLLVYPATDMHCVLDSHRRNGQGYLLTADTMAWFIGHYLARPADADDWRASPLRHPALAGLPPALVITAGFDPLRDEGLAYAQRLSDAGVRCSLVSFERQLHGFLLMGRVLDEANEAVALCGDWLRRTFGNAREAA